MQICFLNKKEDTFTARMISNKIGNGFETEGLLSASN